MGQENRRMSTGPRSSRDFPPMPGEKSSADEQEKFLRRISLKDVNRCPDLDAPHKKAYRKAIGVAKRVIGKDRLRAAFRGRFR